MSSDVLCSSYRVNQGLTHKNLLTEGIFKLFVLVKCLHNLVVHSWVQEITVAVCSCWRADAFCSLHGKGVFLHANYDNFCHVPTAFDDYRAVKSPSPRSVLSFLYRFAPRVTRISQQTGPNSAHLHFWRPWVSRFHCRNGVNQHSNRDPEGTEHRGVFVFSCGKCRKRKKTENQWSAK